MWSHVVLHQVKNTVNIPCNNTVCYEKSKENKTFDRTVRTGELFGFHQMWGVQCNEDECGGLNM
jgi:hypothetical protein